MQTKEGILKTAAKRAGVSFEEYTYRINAGEKRCTSCKEWKARTCFNIDRARGDGLSAKCRECVAVKGKKSTKERISTFKGKNTPSMLGLP